MDEAESWVDVHLGLIPRLRVLFGAVIKVRIAHRGFVDKLVVYLGNDELGSIVDKGEVT